MQGTVILLCNCKSEFQDGAYGKGKRVHNISADRKKAFCTVCEGGARYAKRNSKASPPTTARSSKSI